MELERLFEFYSFTEKLKKVIRYSAQDEIFQENTAAHSWQLMMMAFVTANELELDLDLFHTLKIAMVHDLPEIIAGDTDNTLIFKGKANFQEKEDQEEIAMKQISKMTSEKLGKELFNLWKECQLSQTKEARFVKAMDKFEGITHKILTPVDDPNVLHSVQYMDKSVSNFPELKPLLKFYKNKLKFQVLKQGLEWKKEYEDVLRD